MPAIATITPDELKDLLKRGEAIVVDVREPDEFKARRIPHAMLMPLTNINSQIPNLENEHRKIVFQCLSGTRADMAAKAAVAVLDDSHQIYNLGGGINAWEEAGFTVTQDGAVQGMPIMRQVLTTAGSLILLFSILAISGIKIGAFLTAFMGAGLLMAGVTGWCGMAMLLQKMPWNQHQAAKPTTGNTAA